MNAQHLTARTANTTPFTAPLGTIAVRAQQHESVDALCFRVFGKAAIGTKVTEQVLQLNHGLVDVGEVLPAGTLVLLPQQLEQKKTEILQLWD